MSEWPVDWHGANKTQDLPYISVSQDDVLDDLDSSGQGSSCMGSKLLLSEGAGKEEDPEIGSNAPLLNSGIETPVAEESHGLLGLSSVHFPVRSISECENLISSEPPEHLPSQVEIEVIAQANKEKVHCFTSWNWPIIRTLVSYLSAGTVLSVVIASVALIATLSPDCHNLKNWWQGSVFMESSATMQQYDLAKISDLGTRAFILKDMFEISEEGLTEKFDEVEVISAVKQGLNGNLSFVGEAYIQSYNRSLFAALSRRVEYLGLQGLLLRAMNVSTADLIEMKSEWNKIAYKNFMQQRILVITSDFARLLDAETLEKFDLVYTELATESWDELDLQVNGEHAMEGERSPWIQWALRGNDATYAKAAQFLQLMLPGTPTLEYDPELMNDCTEVGYYTNLKRMIALRASSMSISSNRALIQGDYGTLLEKNTNILVLDSSLVVVERFYPRSSRYVFVANFADMPVRSDTLSKYYFGGKVAASTVGRNGDISFRDFEIGVGEGVVVEMSM